MTEGSARNWLKCLTLFWKSYGVSLFILFVVSMWFFFPSSLFTWLLSAFLLINGVVLYMRQYHRRKASGLFIMAGLSATLPQFTLGGASL